MHDSVANFEFLYKLFSNLAGLAQNPYIFVCAREHKDDIMESMLDFLADRLPKNYKVMDIRISAEVQMEFAALLKKSAPALSLDDFEASKPLLMDAATSLPERKALLVRCSQLQSVEVLRWLQGYVDTCDADIREFARLAAYHNQVKLESDLLQESQVIISGGLGGADNKIRFSVVLVAANHQPFTPSQQQLIHDEFAFVLQEQGAVLEEVHYSQAYARLLMLMPLDIAISRIIQTAIGNCNELGAFIGSEMLISTAHILTDEQIDEVLAQGRSQART